MFKGDTGLFRAALLLSGFFPQSECLMFNDNHKAGTRRLKLWFADAVRNAPQEQQKVLEAHLREAFGDRIISMYFNPNFRWIGPALCIKLKD